MRRALRARLGTWLLVFLLLIVASNATRAQERLAERAKEVPQRFYTLTLTSTEIALIGQALGELKYNEVAALIARIGQQFSAQNKSAPPAAEQPQKE